MKSNFAILVFWFPVNDSVFGPMDRLILDQFHRSLVVPDESLGKSVMERPTQKLIAHRRKMNIIPKLSETFGCHIITCAGPPGPGG